MLLFPASGGGRLRAAAIAATALTLGFCTCPAQVPATNMPPGELAPNMTPQMVLLTFDDAVDSNVYNLVQQVLTNHINPDGGPLQATFYVSLDSPVDFSLINKLYASGHEIGVHTISHATGTNTTLSQWRKELVGCRRALSGLAAIPEDRIRGFRAPYLAPNAHAFEVLLERGFKYDSSFQENIGLTSTSPASMLWPYTLHGGCPQNIPAERKPVGSYPDLFEIPLCSLSGITNQEWVATMDPPNEYGPNDVLELWKTNFLWHYEGNRAPFGVFLHASTDSQWLSSPSNSEWRVNILNEFIDWSLSHSNVWWVTSGSVVDFMENPVSAQVAATSGVFKAQTVEPWPQEDIHACSYPGYATTRVCGKCPPAFPDTNNVYFGLVEIGGGTVDFQVVSQDTSYVYADFTVSNDTEETWYDWSVNFSLGAGSVSAMWDANDEQDGTVVTASARRYNAILAPAQTTTVSFRISPTNDPSFSDYSISIKGLGPQPTRITSVSYDGSEVRLDWEETAFEFAIDWSTNLVSNGWKSLTSGVSCTEFLAVPPETGPAFYRIKGLHAVHDGF